MTRPTQPSRQTDSETALLNCHTDALIQQLARLYRVRPAELQLIQSSNSLIYRCQDRHLRVTRLSVHAETDIAHELGWIEYLRANRIRTVRILPSVNDTPYEKVCVNGEGLIAVCFATIVGDNVRRRQWGPAHFRRLGRLLGELHRVSAEMPETTVAPDRHWHQIPEHFGDQYLPEKDAGLKQVYHTLTEQIRGFPITRDNYGVVHYDIHHGNYLLDAADHPVLLDFSMACQSWFMSDVAIAFYYASQYDQSFQSAAFEDTFMGNFWQGYETEYFIEAQEKERLHSFLLYRDILLIGYLKGIWRDHQPSEQEQQYLDKAYEAYRFRKARSGL